MYQFIKREFLLFVQFGVISLIATTVAFNHFDGEQRGMYLGIIRDDPNRMAPSMNPYEMWSWIWHNYFKLFLLVFVCLSLLRVATVWLIGNTRFRAK